MFFKKLLAHAIIFWLPARFHIKMIPAKEQWFVYGHKVPITNFVRERKMVTWAWKILLPTYYNERGQK